MKPPTHATAMQALTIAGVPIHKAAEPVPELKYTATFTLVPLQPVAMMDAVMPGLDPCT